MLQNVFKRTNQAAIASQGDIFPGMTRPGLWRGPVPFRNKPKREPVRKLPPGIATLDPRNLTSKQYFDISQTELRKLFRKLAPHNTRSHHIRHDGTQVRTVDIPFPENTCGFLYFHSRPNQHPMSGAVRFRVAKEPSKAGFLAGHDLLMAHGLPWQLPLWEVEIRTAYHGIRAALCRDGFFPLPLREACAALNVSRDSNFIGALGVSWVVEWNVEFSRVYFLKMGMQPISALVRHPWYDHGALRQAPYEGKGLVSVIETPSGELGLRIDKVIRLRQYCINMNTVVPVEGLVTPFVTRPLVKSTKHPEEKLISWAPRVLAPVAQLPKVEADPNPFDVYRHDANAEDPLSSFASLGNSSLRIHRYVPPSRSDAAQNITSEPESNPSSASIRRHSPFRSLPYTPPRRPQSDGAPWHSPLVSLVGDAAQRAAETKAAFVPQDINSSSPAQKPDEAQRS